MSKGQIWVETVIYTLIGLSLIGLVLAVVTPKINEYKDKALLDQTLSSLNALDRKVNEVLAAPNNKRIVEFKLGKGQLSVNASANTVTYLLEGSRYAYSEPGVMVQVGRINITTQELIKGYSVEFLLPYSLNITVESGEPLLPVTYSAAAVPYQFSVEHAGFDGSNNIIVDFRENA